MFSFNIQTDITQNDYRYSMNGESQVVTGFEFNCMAVMQGTHHILMTLPRLAERERAPLISLLLKVNLLREA